jgi:hypothetical protein
MSKTCNSGMTEVILFLELLEGGCFKAKIVQRYIPLWITQFPNALPANLHLYTYKFIIFRANAQYTYCTEYNLFSP